MPDTNLDDKIRSLVASAVADAPTAPDIDAQFAPTTRKRPSWPKWTAALAALLAVGGASVALQPADEGDVDTGRDTTATTAVAPVPQPSVIVTAGPDGVREIIDGEERVVSNEAAAFALALDNGDVVIQRDLAIGTEGHTPADNVPVLVTTDGKTTHLLDNRDLKGRIELHDFSVVDDRRLLLYSIQELSTTPQGQGDSKETLYMLDLDTNASTVVDVIGGWESGASRLHLGSNGLIVGTELGTGHMGFYVHAIAGSPAAQRPLPKLADFGIAEATTDGCACSTSFTIDSAGTTLYWLAPPEANIGDVTIRSHAIGGGKTTIFAHLPYAGPETDFGREMDISDRGVVLTDRSADKPQPVLMHAQQGDVQDSELLPGAVATVGPNG